MANELGGHPEDDVLGTVVEVSHTFEVELNILITVNHKLTIEGIAKLEEQEIRHTWEIFDDLETASSHVAWERQVYDDMRAAARHLAVVGLVTRLQHWIEKFVRSKKLTPKKSKEPTLCKHVTALNDFLGLEPPISVEFFRELVTVRDSVVHANSQVEWSFDGKARKVADCYQSSGTLAVTEDQLKDALQNAVELIAWYDAQLSPAKPPSAAM